MSTNRKLIMAALHLRVFIGMWIMEYNTQLLKRILVATNIKLWVSKKNVYQMQFIDERRLLVINVYMEMVVAHIGFSPGYASGRVVAQFQVLISHRTGGIHLSCHVFDDEKRFSEKEKQILEPFRVDRFESVVIRFVNSSIFCFSFTEMRPVQPLHCCTTSRASHWALTLSHTVHIS